MLYDGSVIAKETKCDFNCLVFDDEETLILEEVSRSKMLAKQNDPISKEKKVNTTPINYAELNRLSEDFGKRFVPQQELSDEQAFWLQTSHPNTDQSASSPVKIEAPRELPKVSLVNTSLKKLKYHLGQFDTVVKKRITPDALTEGEWGFEHTKAVFLKEIIPFLKTLKDIFNVFDKDLLNEVTEVQTVFNQMEAAVQQYFVDKQCFEIHKKELFLENDRLLQKIMSQDVMICVMNSTAVFDDVNVEMQSSESCVKCLDLDAELLNKQNAYNDLSKSYSQLEKHCISLELTMQLNQEIFQKDSLSNNQNALEILEYFENNDLKAQLQAKDTTIYEDPFNIELDNRVAKLIAENEHLKQTYKQLYDSIKPLRVKVLAIIALENDLRKLKGKHIVDNAAQMSKATTIAPGLYKLDPVTLAPKIGNVTISRVYYVEGLGHNLFSVGQFCDSDLEVAFRKHSCFVHTLEGVLILLSSSQETNLYTLSIGDMMASSPICLLSSMLKGLKSCKKNKCIKPKSEDTNQEKLYLLHMGLCGPMRVASVNGKNYILVIVDDYSRFTWVKFLASKDEAPDFIIKFLKMIQVRLIATVRNICTDIMELSCQPTLE
ncbi:retrovirus-related pol polyprotein from transposon TNT 1-94 [Tanacetum coccineum]|uniref:Retrovirus-related pol polyprotein from transposon TNT 1-94 n=1 Tax=Tanacetum coccineum TaxID=301880 RepID=A0ABQ5CCD7_9ASTR